MNVISIPPMPQPPEPTTGGQVVGTAWELSRTLHSLKTAEVRAAIPQAKAQQLDPVAIETLELLLAMLSMFDELGLRKRMDDRAAFFSKPVINAP